MLLRPLDSRYVVAPFVGGAPAVLIGWLFFAGLDSTVADIIGIIFMVVGVVLLIFAIGAFVTMNKWNKLRKAGWTRLPVTVVRDDAAGERDKTVLETTDRKHRIALANYPLELRDAIMSKKKIDYVGELRDGKPVLLRPVGNDSEFFGVVRTAPDAS